MRLDSFLLIATLLQQSHAFLSTESSPFSTRVALKSSTVMPDLTFETPDAAGFGIEEQVCLDAA